MKLEDKKYIIDNINKKTVKRISAELGIKERQIREFLETNEAIRKKS